MSTPIDRDRILTTPTARAEADPDVTGAVLLGSSATGRAEASPSIVSRGSMTPCLPND
ncbi:hypothetical protein ABH935_003687 [Catenulispora sp. GAS73]|uniref:hypothetical protein n=1 Tax=Catenulispora sp. GAS73 TaxID=3156269 RepID=UPI0035113325